jgi:hypothetical protein
MSSSLHLLSPKDPNDVLDYEVNWSQWLPTGDTIATSEWFVPDGITQDSESNTNTTTTIWLSGGTAGQSYALTNRITTTQGRQRDRTITIRVREL